MRKWIIIGLLLIAMCIGTASADKDFEWGIRVDVVDTPDPVAPGAILEYDIDYSVFTLSQIGEGGSQAIGVIYDPADLEYISASSPPNHDSPGELGFDFDYGTGSISIQMKVLRATPGIITTIFHAESITGLPDLTYVGESQSTITTEVTTLSPVPEFPSMVIPAVFIIGIAFLVLFVRK